MYRVFGAACAVGALLCLFTSAAFGQAGTIGIFSDTGGTNPFLTETEPGMFSVYVVHVATPGATACQYSAPKPACTTVSYLSDTNPFAVTLGNSQEGVSIGYGACLSGPIHVQTINYFASGTTPSCCHYPVLPHPDDPSGHVQVVDCDFNVLYGEGGYGVINANGCDCPQPTLVLSGYESVSWVDPRWTVRVKVKNNGTAIAGDVSASMHEDIPWLTIPDPSCFYGSIAPADSSTGGSDSYTFDLSGHPGGSFNAWFDVSYEDVCGIRHNLRLDPEFDAERDLALAPMGPVASGLGQNYPNPFNPTTRIPVVLTQDTEVRVSVFDTQGRLVQVLASKTLPAGSNEVVWNGRDAKGNPVSSGMYFCRLETPGTVQTRKLMLLK